MQNAIIETYVRTNDTMTFRETCDFLEIDHVHDGNPPDKIGVCAGEWRREYKKAGDVWRFWSNSDWEA